MLKEQFKNQTQLDSFHQQKKPNSEALKFHKKYEKTGFQGNRIHQITQNRLSQCFYGFFGRLVQEVRNENFSQIDQGIQLTLMQSKIQRIKRPAKIKPIFNHNMLVSKSIHFSPQSRNNLRFDEVSTSPSPIRTDLLSPIKGKLKKSPSKLFQAAHETIEGETFLTKTYSVAFQKFRSLQKISKKGQITQNNIKKRQEKAFTISKQYSIAINGEEGLGNLSLIINQFQNGIFGVFQNIAENSEQTLQLHSKVKQTSQIDSNLKIG